MVQAPLTALTLADFLQLAETKPASEYIDGQILQKPMPQGRHSAIQGELVAAINGVVRSPKIARAFPELRCTFGGRSTVPDIAVFLWDRIPRDSGGAIADAFSVAPDWTIEILSPAQSQTKVTKNILHALQYGTQMGWLIDPEEQTLLIFRPQQQPEVVDVPEGILPVPPFAGALRLTVQEVFAWLLD